MNKGIKLAAVAVALLCICWFAGQQMKAIRISHQEKSEDPESSVWNLLEHMDSDKVTVKGREESDDYPYGYNVGIIEDEQIGKAILLTPDTVIGLEGSISKETSLNMSFFLHPWVAEGSDGALLKVIVTADGTMKEYVYEVSTDLQENTLLLEGFSGEAQIELAVSNEEGHNTDCDWVVLTQCFFSDGDFLSK